MTVEAALMRIVYTRLAAAGLRPIAQHAYLAVRARCPIHGPQDGPYRPLQVGCAGVSAPRWACELNCDRQELDRVLVRVLEGGRHV